MTHTLRTLLLLAAIAVAAGQAHAQDLELRGTLAGGNVVSATESTATGEVAAALADDGTLQLDLVFADLEIEATGAALHTGKFNENGPLVTRLDVAAGVGATPAAAATAGRIAGAEVSLTPAQAAAVRAGESYVVIATVENPDGAIRAQLLPQPVRLDSPSLAVPAPPPTVEAPPTPVPTPEVEPEEEDDD